MWGAVPEWLRGYMVGVILAWGASWLIGEPPPTWALIGTAAGFAVIATIAAFVNLALSRNAP